MEKIGQKIIKEKQKFERLVITKEEALEMFKYNGFKRALIENKIKEGEKTTVYRSGKLVDLCTGPHIPSTSLIKVSN
jgi:threonyl-tRNA synthetase